MPLRSFIDVPAESHFPIQNLPYGVFSPKAGGAARVGVAIGDMILDLAELEAEGFFKYLPEQNCFSRGSLNHFMSLGRATWTPTREIIENLPREDTPTLRDNAALRDRALAPMRARNLHLTASHS